MKRRFFIAFFVLSIYCFGLNSCSKEKDQEVVESKVLLPKRIYSKLWDVTFEYDQKSRLNKTIEVVGSTRNVVEISYPATNEYKVVHYRLQGADTTVIIAAEKNNRIDISGYKSSDGKKMKTSDRCYLLDSQNRVEEYQNGNETVSYSYDEKGNIESRGTKTYTYDNKKGIFSNVKTPQWILTDELVFDQMSDPLFFVNNVRRVKQNKKDWVEYMYSGYTDDHPTVIQIKDSDTGNELLQVTIEYISQQDMN